jgi:small conductance mechanosensitive channel
MEQFIQHLLEQSTLWLPQIGSAMLVFVFFLVLARVMRKVVLRAAVKVRLDGHLAMLLARALRVSLIIFGFVTALGTLGVDISALVAGLGLTGFALGFALKDTISNLLSGVLILLYRPFEVGSRIQVAGNEGIVVSIDLRYTELEFENKKILIPNAKLFVDPIIVLKS